MYHHTAINVLGLLRNMSNNKMNDMQLEVEFKKIEKQFQVKYEELVDLYNRMVLFQIDIEKHAEKESYAGVCDEVRLGVTLIFYLQNMIPYVKAQASKMLPIRGTTLTLSALSLQGMDLEKACRMIPDASPR